MPPATGVRENISSTSSECECNECIMREICPFLRVEPSEPSSPTNLNTSNSKPPAHLPICEPPCNYTECNSMFHFRSLEEQKTVLRRYRRKLTENQARQILETRMQSIKSDLQYLQNTCASHGDLIMSRWKKKNRDKREAILLKVDPNMYPAKWFDPGHVLSLQRKANITGSSSVVGDLRKYPMGYLLPYINVEELKTDPAKFLSLLLNRTRYTPEQWAPHDSHVIQSGWEQGGLDVDFYEGAVIMYGERYGELVDWEKNACERWSHVGFPRANMIILAQASLMSFLRCVVREILEGVDLGSARSAEKWNQVTVQGFKSLSSTAFSSAYLNQPFSAPPILDIDNLISIATTKYNEQSDQFWLMQTDPGYLRRAVKALADANGQPYLRHDSKDYHKCCILEIRREWESCQSWNWIIEELNHVKDLMFKFRNDIQPGQLLPVEVDRALGTLNIMLVKQLEFHMKDVLEMSFKVPGCDKHELPKDLTARFMAELFHEDLLRWTFAEIQRRWKYGVFEDGAYMFSMLESHLKSHSEDKRKISGRLYYKISLATTANELLNTLRMHRPRTTKHNLVELMLTSNTMACRVNKAWNYQPDAQRWENKPQALTLLNACSASYKEFEKLSMPLGKPDKTWITSFDNLWKAFGVFWDIFGDEQFTHLENLGISRVEMEEKFEGHMRGSTSPEFIKAYELDRAKLLARISGTSLIKPSSTYIPWIAEPTNESGNVKITAPRPAKIKTRSEIKSQSEENTIETASLPEIAALEIADKANPIRITVKTMQSYKVLTSMFKSGENEGKMVEWNTFVAAMAEAGFVATNGGGSAVSFEADSDHNWKGKINFHKPHPETKIKPISLQIMGKRMNKWFGWSEETFEIGVKV